jgi:hypothetical protein
VPAAATAAVPIAVAAAMHCRYLYVGTFHEEQEAARAWDLVALKSRGMGAATNFPVGAYLTADGSIVPHEKIDKLVSTRNAKRALNAAAPSPSSSSSSSSSSQEDMSWYQQRPMKKLSAGRPETTLAAAAAGSLGMGVATASSSGGVATASSSTNISCESPTGSTANASSSQAAAFGAEAVTAAGINASATRSAVQSGATAAQSWVS